MTFDLAFVMIWSLGPSFNEYSVALRLYHCKLYANVVGPFGHFILIFNDALQGKCFYFFLACDPSEPYENAHSFVPKATSAGLEEYDAAFPC